MEKKGGHEGEPRSRVRMVVPNRSCGDLIGKGGSNIKSLIEASGVGISISPLDSNYYRFSDRLLMITGSLDKQMEANKLLLHKLFKDPHYPHYVNVPFSYAVQQLCFQMSLISYSKSCFYSNGQCLDKHVRFFFNAAAYSTTANFGANTTRGQYQSSKNNSSTSTGISDDHIGLVLGRGGRNISEISQVSGTRIQISDRGDFISGTNERLRVHAEAELCIRGYELVTTGFAWKRK